MKTTSWLSFKGILIFFSNIFGITEILAVLSTMSEKLCQIPASRIIRAGFRQGRAEGVPALKLS
jgi:hypothetical protein